MKKPEPLPPKVKRPYHPPTLTFLGTAASMTRGQGGSASDADGTTTKMSGL